MTMTPLSSAVCGFAVGILCSNFPWLPSRLTWYGALVFMCATGASLRHAKANHPLLMPALFLVCGILSGQSFTTSPQPPHHLINFALKNQEVGLTFRLHDKPVSQNGKTRITVAATGIIFSDRKDPLPAMGLARLTVNAPFLPDLTAGGHYLARCRLSTPRNFGTPGTFDYKGYLAAQGIGATGWIASSSLIRPIFSGPAPALPWRPRLFEGLRQEAERFLRKTLSQEQAGLYCALLIGDRSGVADETLEHFKASGIMHLLAISGMHLAVLALLTTAFFTFAGRQLPKIFLYVSARKLSVSLSLPLLVCYAGLAGFQPPVVRALVMTVIFMLAILADRQWCSLNNIAIAAAIILAANPLSIFTASFQLSFAATTAIVLIAPRLSSMQAKNKEKKSRLKNISGFLATSLLVSLAAFIATAPFALFHFNRLSLLSPISTLLVSPFLCLWALPLGLIALCLAPLSTPLAAITLKSGAIGLFLSQKIAAILASLPFASLWLPTPTIPVLVTATAMVLVMLTTRVRWLVFVASTCLAALLSGHHIPLLRQQGNLAISYLDVGQGSATVVEMPDQSVTLIDGGGTDSERFNVGEAVIAPFLWHRQIRHLDQIILTHNHSDHFNGLPFLIEKFSPRTLWLSEPAAANPEFTRLLTMAEQVGCLVRVASSGEILAPEQNENPEAEIACLANLAATTAPRPAGTKQLKTENPNDRGLVLRLTHGDNAFLFPGDIERQEEMALLESGCRLKAQVLLMPHHGLASSGSPEFLAAVAPEYLIVSTGKRDLSASGGAACQDNGRLYMTATDGSVFITSDGKKIAARTYYGPGGVREQQE
ncbi:DNA internalization-related competence protein ComEC/Rec2 [Thiovibrio sp. JS02]